MDVPVRKPSMMSRCFHMRAALTGLKRILCEVIRKEQFVEVVRSCKRNAGEKMMLQCGGG